MVRTQIQLPDELYQRATNIRRAFDWRIALSLVQQGVTEFATVNPKDFAGFGFARAWTPRTER